jgi:hypothetical protein
MAIGRVGALQNCPRCRSNQIWFGQLGEPDLDPNLVRRFWRFTRWSDLDPGEPDLEHQASPCGMRTDTVRQTEEKGNIHVIAVREENVGFVDEGQTAEKLLGDRNQSASLMCPRNPSKWLQQMGRSCPFIQRQPAGWC